MRQTWCTWQPRASVATLEKLLINMDDHCFTWQHPWERGKFKKPLPIRETEQMLKWLKNSKIVYKPVFVRLSNDYVL
jgi:hypothetical protein